MENEIDFESTGTVTYLPNDELEKYKKQERKLDNWLKSIGAIRLDVHEALLAEKIVVKDEMEVLKYQLEVAKLKLEAFDEYLHEKEILYDLTPKYDKVTGIYSYDVREV